MRKPRGLALFAGLLAFVLARGAHAYCRTTTSPIPAGYDPTATGCITTGAFLSWPQMPVTYQLEMEASKQVSLAEATPIFERSFAKWAAVSCLGEDAPHPPALSFQDLGPTDAGYSACEAGPCGYDAQSAPHVIIFRDKSWPYNDPSNTLALTTVTFGEDTGHIYAADMEINSFGHTIATSVPPPAGAYSLEAIATHEAGHFVGMAHSQIDTAVMFARYQPAAVTLTQDDIDGICAIYPQEPPTQPSGGCAIAPTRSRASSGDGVTVLLVLLSTIVLLGPGSRRAGRHRGARLKA
jgi:hypothetical protein